MKTYVCTECKKSCNDKTERTYVGIDWCKSCIDKENDRVKREEYLGDFRYKRPPRYIAPDLYPV